ncbi:hypothetical protein L614_002400000370 [Ochrobactrum sp. J50]|jgi:hypothetical protein|nr:MULTISPECIES: hypothetical protein [Brucella/Ochrobactrum group]MCO7726395.1 hypothetical protein [Brucella intermedia]TWH01431.1 hypothetical protein L614_002400000370 [Ochrobactrum sp. J50]WLF95686.1 hypothetical protein Q5698_08375 [Brucella intermedia]
MKALAPVAWMITGFLFSMAIDRPSEVAGLALLSLLAAATVTAVSEYI